MAASVSFNGNKITKELDLIVQVQLPFIASLTLNGRNKNSKSLVGRTSTRGYNQANSTLQTDLRTTLETKFDAPVELTKQFFVKPSTTKNLVTTIKHFDTFQKKAGANARGNTPSKYLRPQVVGGEIYQTLFQQRLVNKGFMPKGNYMMPIKNGKAAYGRNKLSQGEYTKVLWGISAMEELRNTLNKRGKNVYTMKKNQPKEYRTQGSYVHIPIIKNINTDENSKKRFADDIRKLVNKPTGKRINSWLTSLPKAGIYKVKGKKLELVFKQLDFIPSVSKIYDMKKTADSSIKRHFVSVFDATAKEVLEKG